MEGASKAKGLSRALRRRKCQFQAGSFHEGNTTGDRNGQAVRLTSGICFQYWRRRVFAHDLTAGGFESSNGLPGSKMCVPRLFFACGFTLFRGQWPSPSACRPLSKSKLSRLGPAPA
jgi:hypothetical protein